jgi:hypothetical protein
MIYVEQGEVVADFDSTLFSGHVSYMEAAWDFPERADPDILIHLTTARVSNRYVKGLHLGTQYSGQITSSSQLVGYDRSLKQKQTKGKLTELPNVFRLERRFRDRRSFHDVLTMPNPFATTRLYSYKKLRAQKVKQAPEWIKFAEAARMTGVASALAQYRAFFDPLALQSSLKKSEVPWFNPAEWPSDWPTTVIKALHLDQ